MIPKACATDKSIDVVKIEHVALYLDSFLLLLKSFDFFYNYKRQERGLDGNLELNRTYEATLPSTLLLDSGMGGIY